MRSSFQFRGQKILETAVVPFMSSCQNAKRYRFRTWSSLNRRQGDMFQRPTSPERCRQSKIPRTFGRFINAETIPAYEGLFERNRSTAMFRNQSTLLAYLPEGSARTTLLYYLCVTSNRGRTL